MFIIIDKATYQHTRALETIACSTFIDTFGHLYTPENLKNHLTNTCSADFFAAELLRGSKIDMARIGDEVVGYIKYGPVGLPVEHEDHDMEIHRLYVVSGQQGRSIGKQLMNHAMRSEMLQSAPNIYLGVWENNHKAQSFYASYGFSPVGEYLYYVGTHADREIIMLRSS